MLLDSAHIATKGFLACGFLHALPDTGLRRLLLDYLHMVCTNLPVAKHVIRNLTERYHEGVYGRLRNAMFEAQEDQAEQEAEDDDPSYQG